MSVSITLPAVTRPRRRADVLTRLRLLDLLYELLERKLILVVAPAGYGKTTLLIDFVHQKDLSACWYTVDRHDTDLARFLAQFIAAISQGFPAFGALSNAALQRLNEPDYDLETVVSTIVNELYETVHDHFVVVLDDFHLVSHSQPISSFICRFVNRVDDHCHLMIASRREHCIPDFELFQARSQAGVIGFKELAFTPEDLQSFCAFRKRSITFEQASDLVNKNEGWITGLLLSVSLPNQENQFTQAQGVKPDRAVLEKYWEFLFDEQSKTIQEFLLYTSLFDEFNAEILDEVLRPQIYSGPVDWANLIESIKQNNLFVQEVGEDSYWVRYHSLLRDYLNERLKREQPDQIEILLRRLVAAHSRRGEWTRAYHTSKRIKDPSLWMDVIEQAGPALLQQGCFNTLKEWLADLPTGISSTHPGMLSLRGCIALLGNNVPQALDLLNRAHTGYLSTGQLPQIVQTLIRRSATHHFLGDYTSALRDAERALELIAEDVNLLSSKAQALKMKGACLQSLGRCRDGILYLEHSLAIFESIEDFHNVARVNQELGIAQRAMGEFDAARISYLRSEEFWRKEENYHQLADLLNNEGVFYHHLGEYERAIAAFEEGLRYARLTGFSRLEAFLLASLGDVYADLKANDEAVEVYEAGLVIAQTIQNRFLRFYLNFSLSRLARLAGMYDRSVSLLHTAREHALRESAFEQGQLALETGRMKITEGRVHEAIHCFETANQFFQKGNLATETVQVQLYQAAAYLHAGDDEDSLKALSIAFDLGSFLKTLHPLVIAARHASAALERACTDPQLGRKATLLLERLSSLDASIPGIRRRLRKNTVELPAIEPKIIVRAFGEVRLQIDGKTFNTDDWKSRVQRELFFFLLQTPKGVTRETLLSMFWPDAEQNSNLLSNTLYKIRGFLGADTIHFSEGRYFFNRSLDYDYDVESFLEYYETARRADDLATRAEAYQKVLETYQGYYLPGTESIWFETERERLHQMYIESVVNLTKYFLSQGKYHEGMESCWHALKRDIHREEIYRLTMKLSDAMGDRAGISHFYQLCKRALKNTFDADPSRETQILFQQLMS